jgi:hypothetical protein
MYHDTLLAKVARDDPRYKPIIPPSPHTRYTRAWSERLPQYKWAARALDVIQFTQLLIEMGLRRKASTRTKWRGIVLLEAIKYALPKSGSTYALTPDAGLSSVCSLSSSRDALYFPRRSRNASLTRPWLRLRLHLRHPHPRLHLRHRRLLLLRRRTT